MIVYHVSTDLEKDNYFYPRQPASIMKGEMVSFDRVCVSPSIELCLSALPNGGSGLCVLNEEQQGFYKVFKIDTEKLGISNLDIVSDKTLFEMGYVPDAEWTEEHWITTDFTVDESDVFLIQVHDWNEEIYDVIPHHIYELADKQYDGDYTFAYQEHMNSLVPCMCVITDATIVTSNKILTSGDTITFPRELNEEEAKDFRRQVKERYICYIERENEQDYHHFLLESGQLTLRELATSIFSLKESKNLMNTT